MGMNPESAKRVSPARRVAYAGILTALSVVFLYLLYIIPNMTLAILFVLSFLPVVLAHERRYADAALSFAASALLSGLLFFSDVWLLYAAFFGWYAIARELVVGRLGRVWKWVILELIFNAAFFSVYFFARHLFGLPDGSIWQWLIIPAGEVAFLLYENLFAVCLDYYDKHIRRAIYR
jgi:hypothetical protein